MGEKQTGCLYIIATPIGNLEDISLRAIRLLKEVDLIAAEDTRKAHLLLNKYNIKNRLTSYYEHNKAEKLSYLIRLLSEGKDLALISEAGTPGINDPGYELIKAAIEAGIPVVPAPGPSAIITALVVSGLPADQFIYAGYLPRQQAARKSFLKSISQETRTIVCLEAPHRLKASLADMVEILGERKVAICRELTKLHEEVFRGTVKQALEHFTQPRGEFTLVISGVVLDKAASDPEKAEMLLKTLRLQGFGARESVLKVSQTTGMPRREVYKIWLKQLKNNGT